MLNFNYIPYLTQHITFRYLPNLIIIYVIQWNATANSKQTQPYIRQNSWRKLNQAVDNHYKDMSYGKEKDFMLTVFKFNTVF